MYLRAKKRIKDGKEHRYWSIVESCRNLDGRVVQRQVLYLGEINDSQKAAWCRTIDVLQTDSSAKQMALFPTDRQAPELDCEVVQVKLNELRLHHPRQWGACWLALKLWEQLELDRFWQPRLPVSRQGTKWLEVLKTQVCYQLIDPGSEWRLHRHWYLSYTHCDHALCGAHLLRELAFIVDAHGYAWAKRMKRLLLGACHQVSKRDDKTLTPSEYKALQKRYRTILTQGARELPPIPPRQNGQRGKVAKSDAHNLWERMQKHETAVLRFAKHPDVAFTNNRAERDLRMAKVKQKVSGCFRTRKYAEAYCRISSYLQSMANQGYNPLVAIQIALAGRAVDNMGE